MVKQESQDQTVNSKVVKGQPEAHAPDTEPIETLEGKILMPGLFVRRVMSHGRNGKQYANYTLNGTFNGNPIHADFEVSKRNTVIVRNRTADITKGDYVGYETLNVLYGFSDELPLYVAVSSYKGDDGADINSFSYFVGSIDKESDVSLCVKLNPATVPSKSVAEMLVKKSAKLNHIDLGF